MHLGAALSGTGQQGQPDQSTGTCTRAALSTSQHWRSTGRTTGDALGTTLGDALGPALKHQSTREQHRRCTGHRWLALGPALVCTGSTTRRRAHNRGQGARTAARRSRDHWEMHQALRWNGTRLPLGPALGSASGTCTRSKRSRTEKHWATGDALDNTGRPTRSCTGQNTRAAPARRCTWATAGAGTGPPGAHGPLLATSSVQPWAMSLAAAREALGSTLGDALGAALGVAPGRRWASTGQYWDLHQEQRSGQHWEKHWAHHRRRTRQHRENHPALGKTLSSTGNSTRRCTATAGLALARRW
jgi:hypothetical protein